MLKQTILLLILGSLTFAQNLPIKKGSEKYYENGSLKRVRLTQEANVQGKLCTGWLWFHDDGSIRQFQNDKDIVLQDNLIPQMSTIFLREDGSLDHVWLYHDISIQDYPCTGSTWSKTSTGFHPNGTLRYFFPRKTLNIQGFPIKPGGLAGVSFYENGNLHQFYLHDDIEISGITYSKGLRLTLDEQGNVIKTYKMTFWEKYFPMFS
jgi:hypothetical protein